MARIKIQDYIKDVELNRQRLVNATDSDANASLGEVTTRMIAKVSDIQYLNKKSLCEVRFFDADGTLLKSELIEQGQDVLPPNNPNLDPQNLTFVKWTSAIGEQFTNIQHDIDYGATYSINNKGEYFFIHLDESTLTVKVYPIKTSSLPDMVLDWGDGSEPITFTKNSPGIQTHTYSSVGDYTIKLYPTDPSKVKKDAYCYFSQSTNGSYSWNKCLFGDNHQTILKKYYCTKLTSYNAYASSDCRYMVIDASLDTINTSVAFLSPHFIIIPDNYIGNIQMTANANGHISYTKHIILPNTLNGVFDIHYIDSISLYEKLIVPKACADVKIHAFNSFRSAPYKIILLNNSFTNSNSSTNINWRQLLTSFQWLGSPKKIPKYLLNGALVDDFKLPSSVELIESNSISSGYYTTITIPNNCTIQSSFSTYLEEIILPTNWDKTLDLGSCYRLTNNCILNILNFIKDLSAQDSQNVKFASTVLNRIKNINVVKDKLGSYMFSSSIDFNTTTMMEAFNSKNWTIS